MRSYHTPITVMYLNTPSTPRNEVIPFNNDTENPFEQFKAYQRQVDFKLQELFLKRKRILLLFFLTISFSAYLGMISSSYLGFTISGSVHLTSTRFYIISFLLLLSAFTVYGKFLSVLMLIPISFISGNIVYSLYFHFSASDLFGSCLLILYVFIFVISSVVFFTEIHLTSRLFSAGKCTQNKKRFLLTKIIALLIMSVLFNIFMQLLFINI